MATKYFVPLAPDMSVRMGLMGFLKLCLRQGLGKSLEVFPWPILLLAT